MGEYCVHGYEAFPGWHRAYLLEFERVMRRADIALVSDARRYLEQALAESHSLEGWVRGTMV